MATIIPEKENLQKAIKWISAGLDDNEKQSIQKLIDEAVFKFDISPKDTEFLFGFFRSHREKK